MTRSEVFTEAHKLAKKYEGNYSACFALALKEIYASLKNTLIEYQCKGGLKGATKKQFNYLSSFSNVEMYVFFNKFNKYCSISKASELISEAKKGTKIEIFA